VASVAASPVVQWLLTLLNPWTLISKDIGLGTPSVRLCRWSKWWLL